jgi:hypothetical protein
MFSQGYVYAPNRDWADMMISEMATFPVRARGCGTVAARQHEHRNGLHKFKVLQLFVGLAFACELYCKS